MQEAVSRSLDPIYRMCIWVAGLSVAAMSLMIPWGVFARYVLGTGSHWPEPISIMLMVIFTFFGGAAAYRAGAHIAVQMFTASLPAPLQRLAALLSDAVMLAVCGFIVVWGTHLCILTWGQTIDTLPWLPVGATYAALPLGSLFTSLFVLERMCFGSMARRALVTIGEPGADFEEAA